MKKKNWLTFKIVKRRSFFSLGIFLILCFFPLRLSSEKMIQNPDKPAKGLWDFSPRLVWSIDEAKGDVISSVEFLNIDKNGRIYFFDGKQYRVLALSPDGEFLFSFGRKGEGPAEFKYPWDMSLRGDNLVVHDTRCYSLFDLRGRYQRTIKFPGESEGLITPGLLLFSREDESSQSLYLHRIADQSKILLKKMNPPKRLITEGGGLRIRVRDANIVSGLFQTSADEQIVFGQSADYRLFIADFSGKITKAFGIPSRSRPKIPEEYKAVRYKKLKVNGTTISPAMVQQLVRGIPDQGPHFNQVMLHDSGLILVMVPEYHKKNRQYLDIFSPQGIYLYRGLIKMPDKMPFNRHAWRIYGDTLVMYTEGPDDEGALKKFKINLPVPVGEK